MKKKQKRIKRGRKARKNKKDFSLKEQYLLSWNYIKESRNFIYSVVGIFVFFTLIGFFVPAPDFISEQILQFIQNLVAQTQGLPVSDLIIFILLNNLQTSFFGIVLGAVLGIFPFFAAIANGYLLGFVSTMSVGEGGFSVLLKLLPHGIFELPATFISFGLGLKLGTFIFRKDKAESFREYFWNSIRVFLFVVVPLLIVAAIIEGSLIAFWG
jgi:stage II sporulation protein M